MKKITKLNEIIADVKKTQKQGKKLYFYGNVGNADYNFYTSPRNAIKEENKGKDPEGSNLIDKSDIEEVDMDTIISYLEDDMDPFEYLYHTYTFYPYHWLQDIEDYFKRKED